MLRSKPLALCGLLSCIVPLGSTAQVSNVTCTSAEAVQVMEGSHDPMDHAASTVIDDHHTILCELRTRIDADSLKGHLEGLLAFHNRNTHSDTVSASIGIGAARRWLFDRFVDFSDANEGRLIPAYLRFDYNSGPLECGDGVDWRNVMAVLPGSDVTEHRIVLIEAHYDSRCADNCDTTCYAPGAEDNGSGVALVMELARVLSRYTFRHSIVFLLTTGEEHGLLGAEAMATFCTSQGIAIKAVQNNDVIGGVLCGTTSSPPSCIPVNGVDSLQVRLFSSGSISQPHRNFARTIKMYYEEKMADQVPVPMSISIMDREDRVGRGGDHIPFRMAGYRNVRFTSANEHGHGDPSEPGYSDRQHTSDDVIGIDTTGDLVVDSFFVDFGYLQRNTLINGVSAVLLALGPETPEFTVLDEPTGLRVSITQQPAMPWYRIGVRDDGASMEFDAVYRTPSTDLLIPGLTAMNAYFISVAGIDSAGIMSPFSHELVRVNDAATPAGSVDDLPFGPACDPIGITGSGGGEEGSIVLSCLPHPFQGSTVFQVHDPMRTGSSDAVLVVRDIHGKEVGRIPFTLVPGPNRVAYQHQGDAGVHVCSLEVLGRAIASQHFVVIR